MIIQANGSTEKGVQEIVDRLEEFVEMVYDENQELKFSLQVGVTEKDKFRVSNAVNALQNLEEDQYELLEEHNLVYDFNNFLDELENLSWKLDEKLKEEA